MIFFGDGISSSLMQAEQLYFITASASQLEK
jgi:hypothetical protein